MLHPFNLQRGQQAFPKPHQSIKVTFIQESNADMEN